MPKVIEEAQRALADGCAVVIGLQTTGEAAADALGLQPGQLCGFTSTVQEMLQRFVATHFPTRYQPSDQESKSHFCCIASMPQHEANCCLCCTAYLAVWCVKHFMRVSHSAVALQADYLSFRHQ